MADATCPKGHEMNEANTYRPPNSRWAVCRRCRREGMRRLREERARQMPWDFHLVRLEPVRDQAS